MKKINKYFIVTALLLLILFSLQLSITNSKTDSKINYESGWISRKNKKYMDIYVKNQQGNTADPTSYNLTVKVKKSLNLTDTYFNQTIVAFINSATEFKIYFQTNENLTLSYLLYPFNLDQYTATATAPNNAITLVKPKTTSFSTIAIFTLFPSIYIIRKLRKLNKS